MKIFSTFALLLIPSTLCEPSVGLVDIQDVDDNLPIVKAGFPETPCDGNSILCAMDVKHGMDGEHHLGLPVEKELELAMEEPPSRNDTEMTIPTPLLRGNQRDLAHVAASNVQAPDIFKFVKSLWPTSGSARDVNDLDVSVQDDLIEDSDDDDWYLEPLDASDGGDYFVEDLEYEQQDIGVAEMNWNDNEDRPTYISGDRHHRNLLLCDITESLFFLVQKPFERWLNEKYDGYKRRLTSRKSLEFHKVQVSEVNGCTIEAKIDVTLHRKWRRNGRGPVTIQATLDMGRLAEDVLGTQDISQLADAFNSLTELGPDMLPSEVCLKNIKVVNIKLSHTSRFTEKRVYLPIARNRLPSQTCFNIDVDSFIP